MFWVFPSSRMNKLWLFNLEVSTFTVLNVTTNWPSVTICLDMNRSLLKRYSQPLHKRNNISSKRSENKTVSLTRILIHQWWCKKTSNPLCQKNSLKLFIHFFPSLRACKISLGYSRTCLPGNGDTKSAIFITRPWRLIMLLLWKRTKNCKSTKGELILIRLITQTSSNQTRRHLFFLLRAFTFYP